MGADLRGDLLGAKTDLSEAALWTGVFAGPIAWALDLTISYALVPWSCRAQSTALLHFITLGALAIIAGGAYAAWSAQRHDRRGRFLTMFALLFCGLSALVVIGGQVPRVVLHVCQ